MDSFSLVEMVQSIGPNPPPFPLEFLPSLEWFVRAIKLWCENVYFVVTQKSGCLNLIGNNSIDDNCIGSPLGARNAFSFIEGLLNARGNANWGAAVLQLMLILDLGGISDNAANDAADLISRSISINCNSASIRWLRNSLHTEVQLLVLMSRGIFNIADKSLVLSLKEPCKSCVQTPVLDELKRRGCYFVSMHRDDSNPKIECVNTGLIQKKQKGLPKPVYISVKD